MPKICRTCSEEKSVSEFRKDKSQRDGYRTECKICSRLYHQAAYTIKYGEAARARSRTKHSEIGKLISEYKVECGCKLCSEKESVCLEFHHLDSTQKDFEVSASRTRSWVKIQAEIEKCVVLCSNCHRKVHAGILQLHANLA